MTKDQRIIERRRVMQSIQVLLSESMLCDAMTVAKFKKLLADLKDCLLKWTAKEQNEEKNP